VFVYTVTSAPAASRPVPETKSKASKTVVQSAPVPVTKAIALLSFQHIFAYLARAAVKNKFVHLFVVTYTCTCLYRTRCSELI